MKKIFLLIPILLISLISTGQETLILDKTKPFSWNSQVPAVIFRSSPAKGLPLVIYCHGVGEQGSDGLKIWNQGLPKVLKDGFRPPYEIVMIAPQSTSWLPPSWIPYVIKDMVSRFDIDTTRIYITGVSAGGWPTWGSVTDLPLYSTNRIAAIAPLSSVWGDVKQAGIPNFAITKTPVWAIVGGGSANDETSFREGNINLVNKVNALVPGLAKLTIRPGFNHGPWLDIYTGSFKDNGETIWDFFKKHKGTTGVSVPEPICNPNPPKVHLMSQSAAAGELYRPNVTAVKGGDTIKITGTKYNVIEFFNLAGDECNSVVVMPLTTLETPIFRITGNSRYVKVWGGPSKYGIKINGGALAVTKSHHIEADNIEISGGTLGVYAKQDVDYNDRSTWGANYYMPKLTFKNLWIHDINGEGMYVGVTSPSGVTVKSTYSGLDTVIIPIRLDSVEISNCIVERTQWDGIQLSHSPNGNKIYNNTVRDYGLKNLGSQQNGIVFGGNCNGDVYGNTVENGTGSAIVAFGPGIININDNKIKNGGTSPGQDAIYYVRHGNKLLPKQKVNLSRNIINGATRNGIRNANDTSSGLPGLITDNVITNTGAAKYSTAIGDQIKEPAAPVVPTVTQAYFDSVVNNLNISLSAAIKQNDELKTHIFNLNISISELKTTIQRLEAIRKEFILVQELINKALPN